MKKNAIECISVDVNMETEIKYSQNKKLESQINFIVQIDKVKNIIRKSKLFDGSRFENDAEHSWTICVMALLLKEYSDFEIDIGKVLVMLLIHDIVEIEAGDTFLYSSERENAILAETEAANRIFGILDEDQKVHFLGIWNEFESRETNEAKFAAVFDRLEPIIQNYMNEGSTWKNNHVTYEMVIEKNKHIKEGSGQIWSFTQYLLDTCVEKGYIERQNNANNERNL